MLAACEMSGRVRDAFAARGWEAWSADLLPSESPCHVYEASGEQYLLDCTPYDEAAHRHHYQGDVRDVFSPYHPVNRYRECRSDWGKLPLWDLIIAFPECTHLSLAGAVHWKAKRADGRQDAAAAFFMEMTRAPAAHVAVENPRGDMTRRYRAPDQYVQPYWFGDRLAKLTGLWLENLPLLVADNLVEPEGRVATGGGSWRTDLKHGRGPNNGHEDGEGRARRQVVRNRTLPGLARAMAAQWGPHVEKENA